MNTATKPKLLKREAYQPILSELERRAYQAAQRLMTEDITSRDLACPGAKRSFTLDRMAKIIVEELGAAT